MNNFGGIVKKTLANNVLIKNQIVNPSIPLKTFQHIPEIPGLYILPNLLTEVDEEQIVKGLKQNTTLFPINQTPNLTLKRRRQAWYGWSLKLRATEADYTPLSEWCSVIWNNLLNKTDLPSLIDIEKEPVDSFMVIKYENGQGIHEHTDEPEFYGSYVLGVSFLRDAEMDFTLIKDPFAESQTVILPARSVYLLTGSARDDYLHGIQNEDEAGALRMSVTMRHHKETFLTDKNRRLKTILGITPSIPSE